MPEMTFAQAVDSALAQAMAADPRVMVMGEDVRMLRRNLFVRFGGDRVRNTPISEAGFLGAAVGAAMAGLRPVAEIMMVDFIAVAVDALLNHAAKLEEFSGGRWRAPLVVRAACGAGYGDGGQHGQCLWGWLAHIPGLAVAVPSTPSDAGGLLLAAMEHEGPAVFLEHKLLADYWLDYLGGSGRDSVSFDVPAQGARGQVPETWRALSLGRAEVRRQGGDLTMASLGVGVHRCLEAAARLEARGIKAGVIDLRWAAPLDEVTLSTEVLSSGRLLVVDEDYQACGLSGEIAAALFDNGLSFRFARVCTRSTLPYARHLEDQALPNTDRIVQAAESLLA